MVDPILSILGMVAGKFFIALTSKVASEVLLSKLTGDPVHNAFKQALGKAIHRYATTDNTTDKLLLARHLLKENGPLTKDSVAEELMQIVCFEREPNAELIGDLWKAAIDDPPQWCDFTKEAELLLRHLKEELRGTTVFCPVFSAKSLDSIDTTVDISAKILEKIEDQLAALIELMDTQFGDLIQVFTRASPSIHEQIRDYTLFIEEKTRGFVGRQWVFDAVNRFIDENPRGYFFIIGDPGIGKSALAAKMVKQNGYIYHFNIRAQGISEVSQFLNNVCAQLIAKYQLEHTILPPETTKDSSFLDKLLVEVSNKLESGEKCVIIVDALDEAKRIGIQPGENLLHLPLIVPKGVFIVVTMRDKKEIWPHVQCEQDKLVIEVDSSANLMDVEDFLRTSTARPGIPAYIEAQNIETQDFVTMMVKKSEGNFMYLHYVLPEIERGAYKDLELNAIPVGLENYYEDHWKRMGMMAEPLPRTKINIIYIMAEVRHPVSRQLLSEFAGVDQFAIQEVLDNWHQFLHEQIVGEQKRYSIYHTSFLEFLRRRDIVQAAGISIKNINAQIADNLWKEVMEDE